ncbi:hypothetical protein C8N25_10552 [Algoriphagus antarcticus]|uniref:Uncharacterized protein n=1 Tax=Algoriphagus antarcticus TaxID=238540 RepID=A0A3E0DXY4_9BACT|nr:hypothetical protein C8N25_10552 [Algoriphagus antarcticus]
MDPRQRIHSVRVKNDSDILSHEHFKSMKSSMSQETHGVSISMDARFYMTPKNKI